MDFLSKFLFNYQSQDEKNELNYIIKGYPLTTSPVIPDILKLQVEYKTLNDQNGTPIVALTLAHEGSDLVEPESLEVIRTQMSNWLGKYPESAKYFEKELPRNLIAISFTHTNFQMGKESCHDFKLTNGYKEAENSFYTYRKLSECLQCVYLNENGVEYMAGGCFYPTPHGKPKLLNSNDALVHFATQSKIGYPLCDRRKLKYFVNNKFYTRYCATAGKSVMVLLNLSDGIPRHSEYNHVDNMYEQNLCKECLQDYFTYKWEEPKKDTPASTATVVLDDKKSAEASAAPLAPTTPVPDPAAAADSDASAVSSASSTESLIEGFEKVEVSSEDAESGIDAELID